MSTITPATVGRQLGQELTNGNDKRQTWGDDLPQNKSNKNLRIILQNINGFGDFKGSTKSEAIKEMLLETDPDIYIMVEVNVNWRIVAKQNSIYDMMRGWFENQSVIAGYNQRDRTCNKYQPGGTAILSKV